MRRPGQCVHEMHKVFRLDDSRPCPLCDKCVAEGSHRELWKEGSRPRMMMRPPARCYRALHPRGCQPAGRGLAAGECGPHGLALCSQTTIRHALQRAVRKDSVDRPAICRRVILTHQYDGACKRGAWARISLEENHGSRRAPRRASRRICHRRLAVNDGDMIGAPLAEDISSRPLSSRQRRAEARRSNPRRPRGRATRAFIVATSDDARAGSHRARSYSRTVLGHDSCPVGWRCAHRGQRVSRSDDPDLS